MRVAIVVPMQPGAHAAVLMMSAVHDLVTEWDLEIWSPSEADYLPCPVALNPYRRPTAEVVDSLTGFDLVVYVLSDERASARIVPLALRLPGLIVLTGPPPAAAADPGQTLADHVAAVEASLGVVVATPSQARELDGRTLGSVTVSAALVRDCADDILDGPQTNTLATDLLEAADRALATKPLARLNADLRAHLRRLGLDQEPTIVEVITGLAIGMFGPR